MEKLLLSISKMQTPAGVPAGGSRASTGTGSPPCRLCDSSQPAGPSSRVCPGDESPAVLALGAPLFSSFLKRKSPLQALSSCASVFGRDVLGSVASPLPLEPRLILSEGCQLICCPVRHQLLPERSPECSHKASGSLFTPCPHNTLAT